jgi:hypothetical protein
MIQFSIFRIHGGFFQQQKRMILWSSLMPRPPLGPWLEHPKSPIVSGNANKAAPGGQVVVFDNRVVRYAQDVEPYYGNQVWAFEITKLTKDDYEERQAGQRPILKGYDNWNTRGMHQISPVRIGREKWIAAVDGY